MLGKFEENCLLALIRAGRKSTAADVFDVLVDRSGQMIQFGALYTTLDRMVDKKWVKVEKKAEKPGGRQRRYFTITGLGQKTLSESLASTKTLADGLNIPGWAEGRV